ncbi:CoA transferase subunit A [Eisenibacter elegans]|uniref:CoA transferase subunit A n=1 Tax=Eisenibacter elegans TaxID=997 RepID=UPI00041CCBC1|nr:CoA transferase subunit A [Eisenibacter elegans]
MNSPKITSLSAAIAANVQSGQSLALEGFTHLIPFAAAHELIRQGLRDLTLIRMTPDLVYDQLIGAGCVRKIIFSWGGNPGVGSLHRFRDAYEQGYPQPLEIEEYSHAAMANAYQAGASGLPFAVLRGFLGTDLARLNPEHIRWVTCPFTGESLAAVRALQPDVTIIHAQQADREGNVRLWGIVGVQKEAALAAQKVVVTVEEIVDKFEGSANDCIIPHWVINNVALVPKGAAPSYAMGYYKRNNAFYLAWDEIARSREGFQQWIAQQILSNPQH